MAACAAALNSPVVGGLIGAGRFSTGLSASKATIPRLFKANLMRCDGIAVPAGCCMAIMDLKGRSLCGFGR